MFTHWNEEEVKDIFRARGQKSHTYLATSIQKVDIKLTYSCTYGCPRFSWRSTLPCLTESSLLNSFVQPFHEVDVSDAARQGHCP